MSLSVGIVGLPNVGKSTLFNALLKRQIAEVAAYPFTTIKPHTGVVAVPDEKLERLAELVIGGKVAEMAGPVVHERERGSRQQMPKVVPATVMFMDIAGLVKNAHQGEGLGNEFLGQIRNVDAIVHVVRGFDSEQAPHVAGSIDMERDIEIIDHELRLADIDKPVIYLINGDEKSRIKNQELRIVRVDLSDPNIDLMPLVRAAYELLNLITFYTIKGGKEIRAWSLRRGLKVIDAAEKVHTDFAKNFIKAEVINVDELLSLGSWAKAKQAGKIRLEGRDYIVNDEEVVEFKVGVR